MKALNPVRPSEQLAAKLLLLWERTGDPGLQRLAKGEAYDLEKRATFLTGDETRGDDEAQAREYAVRELNDWVSTGVMNCFKESKNADVFAVLYELNQASFLQAIQSKLRRCVTGVDSHDVLQEVFLNIYRYPHRFVAEKADSFRNWGHRIVRNTMLKFLKLEGKRARFTPLDEEVGERPDTQARTPLRSATDAEIAGHVDRAFLIYLNLYLLHFQKLSEKEQRALTMVEVEGCSYKTAADALGIRLENLKMVIFRGRQKVLRGLGRSLTSLESRAFEGDSMYARPASLSRNLSSNATAAHRTAAPPSGKRCGASLSA